MYKARILIKSASHITGEEACELRARALRYALDRYFEKQKAAKTGGIEKDSRERRASSRRDEDREQ